MMKIGMYGNNKIRGRADIFGQNTIRSFIVFDDNLVEPVNRWMHIAGLLVLQLSI